MDIDQNLSWRQHKAQYITMCMEFPFMDEHGDNAACCNNVHVHVVAHQDLAAYDVSQGQVVEDFSEEFDHL